MSRRKTGRGFEAARPRFFERSFPKEEAEGNGSIFPEPLVPVAHGLGLFCKNTYRAGHDGTYLSAPY